MHFLLPIHMWQVYTRLTSASDFFLKRNYVTVFLENLECFHIIISKLKFSRFLKSNIDKRYTFWHFHLKIKSMLSDWSTFFFQENRIKILFLDFLKYPRNKAKTLNLTSSSRRYSTKSDDSHLTGMIFIYSRQYSTKADDTHLTGTIFI
jgi:hypothetical protein